MSLQMSKTIWWETYFLFLYKILDVWNNFFFLILIHDIKDALNNVRDIFSFLKNKKALKDCTPNKNFKQFINFLQKMYWWFCSSFI